MTPTRWQVVQSLVSAALDLPAEERAAFVQEACAGDSELEREVWKVIESYDDPGEPVRRAVDAYAASAFTSKLLGEGDRIGAYQITGVIGRGGMGTVYCAKRFDDQFRQRVAIKVVGSGFGVTPELSIRFRAERQILANLIHPNIARLLDGGVTGQGLPYLVMEYIEGTMLDSFVKERELNIRDRLDLFRQICAAVQYAHQNLVVHRDIKPANVMVTRDNVPKLLDFGIAKLLSSDAGSTRPATRQVERLMTPEYASPEQIRGEAITTATDVYALGVLLYELLTGKRPFGTERSSPEEIERLIRETSPPRPSAFSSRSAGGPLDQIDGDLDNVVLKAIHKEAQLRYASAAELSDDVQRYLQGFPVIARPDSWLYRARKFVSRHKLATVAALSFAVTTTALSIGLAIQEVRARREARTARQVSNLVTNLFENSLPEKRQGRTFSSRELLDWNAQAVSEELAGQPLLQARLFNTLGSVYYSLGIFDEAEKLLTRSYEIRKRLLGPDSVEASEPLLTLADIYSGRAQVRRALTAFESILGIYTKRYGRLSEKTATVISALGQLEWSIGAFKAAGRRDSEAVEIWKKLKGPSDPHTLTAENDLETVLSDEGDYQAAESLAKEVLERRLEVLGPNHPDIIGSLNNLAILKERTGHLQKAEATEKQAFALCRRLLGTENAQIAIILSNLNRLARKLGRDEEAERLGRQSVAIATKLIGPESLAAAACEGQLGLTLLARGEANEARQMLKASLATRIARSRSNSPQVGDSYERLGLADLYSQNLTSARENMERGLKLQEQFYGWNNDNVASTLIDLGRVFAAERNYAAAEETYRKAIGIMQSKFKEGHPITADALLGLGTTLMAEGRLEEARTPLARSLEMRRGFLPADDPAIEEASQVWAKCERLTRRASAKEAVVSNTASH